ncbi:hypothetical protein FB645_000542 [Coemansia sp. IMI 203386]|nr:hypothetical protein FB645_000542 [Coemansia sp. IMI 203386]
MDIDSGSPNTPDNNVVSVSNITDTPVSQINALCDEIEKAANYIAQSRQNDQTVLSESREDLLHNATNMFVRLRLLNRRLHEDKASLSQAVSDMKQKADDLALKLENKRREISYVQKEIESTEKLETIYQNIEIIPLQQFMETAPDEYKQNLDNQHELMLNRLRYEIRQREMLMEEKARVKSQRDELRQAKRQRVEKLENIDNHIQNYTKSLKALDRAIDAADGSVDDEDRDNQRERKGGSKPQNDDQEEQAVESKRVRELRGESSSRVGTPRV